MKDGTDTFPAYKRYKSEHKRNTAKLVKPLPWLDNKQWHKWNLSVNSIEGRCIKLYRGTAMISLLSSLILYNNIII